MYDPLGIKTRVSCFPQPRFLYLTIYHLQALTPKARALTSPVSFPCCLCPQSLNSPKCNRIPMYIGRNMTRERCSEVWTVDQNKDGEPNKTQTPQMDSRNYRDD